MAPLLLPPATWDTVTTLAFDRKVLVVGPADGNDVVSLARTALVVCVYMSSATADIGRQLHRTQELDQMLTDKKLGHRVILHAVPAILGITQYHTGQFDLVLFNPEAAGDDDPGGTIAQLAEYAKRLVIAGSDLHHLWYETTSHLPENGYSASCDGSAIFVSMGTPEPIERRD